MSLQIINQEVFINGKQITNAETIGSYILDQATEADEIEINFRATIEQMTAAYNELIKLNDWMTLHDGEKACIKLPILDVTGFQVAYRSSAVLMQFVNAYNNGKIKITK
jgi:predicted metalloendopeptidase